MSFILGLTGSIATGKTTVSHLFMQAGFPVVDGDVIAREVVEPGTIGLKRIEEVFGAAVIQENGQLNRGALGEIVFANEKKLNQLNKILGKEINQGILQAIEKYRQAQIPLIVVDIPLLYENDYQKIMDQVMVVYVPQQVQLERLMARDHLSEEEAWQRINSQWSIEDKKKQADILIENTGTTAETGKQIYNWLKKNRFV